MWKRITPRRVLAALPDFALAVVFFGVVACGSDWGGRVGLKDLERWMTFELLIMHAFPFLMAVIAARPKTPAKHVLRGLVFGALLFLYCFTAHAEDGWAGVAMLFALGLATYMGFFLGIGGEQRMAEVGLRWMVGVVTLFFGIAAPLGLILGALGTKAESLTGEPMLGLFYFFALGCYELFGLYDAALKRRPAGTLEPA